MSPPGAGRGAPLAWGLVGALLCLAVLPFGISLLEEGIVVHVAQRLAQGEHLYRDVLAFTGPAPFESLALIFRVFGESLVAGRVAVALLQGLATAATYALARRAGGGLPAHAAAATMALAPWVFFPLFHIFYYSTLAVQLSVVAAWAALRGTRSTPWAVTAGVLVAAVALCKQSVGAVLALCLGLALLACAGGGRRLRTGLAFGGGGTALALLTVAAFAAQDGLFAMLHAVLVLPLTLEQTFSLPLINLWPPGQLAPAIRKVEPFYLPYSYVLATGLYAAHGRPIVVLTQALYVLPFAALLATLLHGVRRRLHAAAWLNAALLVAWIANLFPRADWGHLAHVLPASTVQLLLLRRAGAPATGRARVATRAGAVAVMGVVGAAALWTGQLVVRAADPRVLSDRVPFHSVNPRAWNDQIRRALGYVRARVDDGEPIFVPRAEPLLYFAGGLRNATPFPGVIPGMREEQQRIILAALAHVRFVLMSDVDSPTMTFYGEQLPAVERYLERYYHVAPAMPKGRRAWLVVLERGEDRGATAVDLWDHRDEARAWLRDAAGATRPGPRFSDRISIAYNRRPLCFYVGRFGGGLDFDVDVPPHAVFQAGVGLRSVLGQRRLYRHAQGGVLRISVVSAGSPVTLAEVVPLAGQGDDGGWRPVEVDLSAYADQRVTLRLELDPEEGILVGDSPVVAYLGSPRIAVRPPGNTPPGS